MAQFRHSYSLVFPFRSRSCLHLVVIKINNLVGGVIRACQSTTHDMYCIHHASAQIWLYIGGIGLPIGTMVTVCSLQHPDCHAEIPGRLPRRNPALHHPRRPRVSEHVRMNPD